MPGAREVQQPERRTPAVAPARVLAAAPPVAPHPVRSGRTAMGMASLLALQRSAGNRAVAGLAAQPKPAPVGAAPAAAGALVVQRVPTQNQQRPPMIMSPETLIIRRPDVPLFAPQATNKRWDLLKPKFVPLAGGTLLVDGIPVSYALEGSASASSWAGMVFGPADLHDIQVYVTGAEAARLRRLQNPMGGPLGPFGLGSALSPLGPINPLAAIGAARYLGSRPWDTAPEGRFGADGMVRFEANAFAGARADARLDASLGVFGNALSAGAFAGLGAAAEGKIRTSINTFVSASYADGGVTCSLVLDFEAGISLKFSLNAFAGVWVELRVPEIPVVTELTHKMQDWPIINWFTPDLTKWRWRKEYRKDWPLFNKSYDWSVNQRFSIGPSGTTGSLPDAEGFSVEQLLRDAEAQQKEGTLKDDPEGPGNERRNGDQGAISAAKAEALAQIASAQRSAAREKKGNARLLVEARKAAAKGPSKAAAPSLVVGGGGGPVEQVEERGAKLDAAVAATTKLREKTDALAAPAAAEDGPSRNEAREGFAVVAKNADALGDAIDQGAEGFEVPAAVEPSDADYQLMKDAMHKAYAAFDETSDPVRTEKLYADDQLRQAGSAADLAAYRHAAEAYQHDAGALWRRVQKLEEDLDKAREWYERGDHALGTKVFGELEVRARTIVTEVGTLKAKRPVGDWDDTYVELANGQLVLKPQYRGKATRSYFYPHDYSSGTRNRMLAEIGGVQTGQDGLIYWQWTKKLSPRGDHSWLFDDPQEMPTLDHTQPTVLKHWNDTGRKGTYDARRSFYDFVGMGLTVVPKSLNSSAGGKEPDSYLREVTRAFRGAKT